MNLVDFFKDVLRQQLLHDKDLDNHIIDTQDVMLEDIIAVGGENAPGVKKMANNKFEISGKTSGMTAYSGGEASGLHKTGAGYAKSELSIKFVRAYFVLTHPQLVAVAGKDSAVLDSAKEYSEEIRDAMARAKSRNLRGDGSGISGVLPDTGVQVGLTINISGRAPGTFASHNIYGLGTLEFMEGEPILFGTKAQLDAGTAQVSTIDQIVDGTTLLLKTSVTVGAVAGANNRGGTNADTWYIVRGDIASNEWGTVPMGVFGMIDDGTFVPTFQTLPRATTPFMKSIVINKPNASNILDDFTELHDAFRIYGKPKYFKVSRDVYRKYSSALLLVASSTGNRTDYKSKLGVGHSGLEFNFGNSGAIPIISDTFFPHGQVLIIDPKLFFEASLFAEDFIPGYFMKPIDASTEVSYETVRGAYCNNGTHGSRKLGAKMNYETV